MLSEYTVLYQTPKREDIPLNRVVVASSEEDARRQVEQDGVTVRYVAQTDDVFVAYKGLHESLYGGRV